VHISNYPAVARPRGNLTGGQLGGMAGGQVGSRSGKYDRLSSSEDLLGRVGEWPVRTPANAWFPEFDFAAAAADSGDEQDVQTRSFTWQRL